MRRDGKAELFRSARAAKPLVECGAFPLGEWEELLMKHTRNLYGYDIAPAEYTRFGEQVRK